MSLDNLDKTYIKEVDHILNNDEFVKTKDCVHHGQNRYDHLIRVSYFSYKISKFFGLNYKSAARGGLLHDFFLESTQESLEKGKLIRNHPKLALINASNHFELNDLEKDIIATHMFPVTMTPPKYAESWIVDIVDDLVSIYERCYNASKELVAGANLIAILLIGSIK